MKHFSSICLLVIVAVLSGCGTPGFPRQSYDEKKQIRQLEKVFEKPDLITKYYTLTNAPEEVKRAERNRIVDGRLALMNLNYNQFVARVCIRKESMDFGAEVTELGLNLATTAVGGAATKTVLGAVSSGVTGTKLAIDKNFFFEKTVPVLIASMNAQRKQALAPILMGMKKSTDEYPLTQALSDLDAYYFAGTFIGALQAVQADAGAKEKVAQARIDSIRFAEDDSVLKLRAWLWPDGPTNPVNATNLEALRNWKKDRQLEAVKIERFLEEEQYKTARQQAAEALIKPDNR
jgi:hypothetical protein